MKIRFLEDTYIRRAPHVKKGDLPLGTVFKGAELEVAPEAVRGDTIQQNNLWYRDQNGWFYWSGRTETLEEEAPPGSILGGIMVAPAPAEPAREGPPVPPAAPPLANDDALLRNEEIPEGETRTVPPLEVLLAAETQARPRGLPKPPPELPSPPAPAAQILAVQQEPEPELHAPPAPPEWRTADPKKLNWGILNNRIDRDWWQQRQLTGRGTSVAILSTGAPPGHPDLPNLAAAFQYANEQATMADRHGLGTQAAIVAAGAGNQVFGVAPEATLLLGKIGEQDHLITAESLAAGLEWAIDAGADVVAMLVDLPEIGEAQSEDLQALIDRAVQRGMLLVAPVGTMENKKPESRYPACMAGVLSVGAHDLYGQRSSFSARSYDLDLLAPGEGLLTSGPQQTAVWNLKSCSIAAAFVAGFLALVRQWQCEHGRETAPEAVFNLLRNTAVARRAFNKGEDVEYGYGALNAGEILKNLDHPHKAGE